MSIEDARAIVDAIHKHRNHGKFELQPPSGGDLHGWTEILRGALSQARPLIVGVFADNSPEFIKEILSQVTIYNS